jgi:hypothetical protein
VKIHQNNQTILVFVPWVHLFLIFLLHETLGVGGGRSTSSCPDARKVGRSIVMTVLRKENLGVSVCVLGTMRISLCT